MIYLASAAVAAFAVDGAAAIYFSMTDKLWQASLCTLNFAVLGLILRLVLVG